jgi:enoyl-CoA hydratase
MRLILSGDLIKADEAERIGLVEQMVPANELREHTLGLAGRIAARGPIALQAAKETIQAASRMPLEEGLKFERAWFGLLFSTKDLDEGVSAFLEKRPPAFTGE